MTATASRLETASPETQAGSVQDEINQETFMSELAAFTDVLQYIQQQTGEGLLAVEPYTRVIVDARGRWINPDLWALVLVCSVTDGQDVKKKWLDIDKEHRRVSEGTLTYYGSIADGRRRQRNVIERLYITKPETD